MGTQLNIKSDDAYALASRLAELTGESLTTAVTVALRERLEREETARGRTEAARQALIADVLALGRELRRHVQPGTSSADHADLYGEDGLPR
ncbi:MAG: type II toxin-antitoxin system VapB family antitoxin [Acetobacteraceae bacterium]|nr:type II toxin-antitoxin system VapB family antitoxin [Acetobacteraceae bacterium]